METKKLTIFQHIRKRPGMYLGDTQSNGAVVRMIGELMANVVDLFLEGEASRFSVTVDADDFIVVEDDGPGLPFDELDQMTGLNLVEKHLTVGHDSPTADGHLPHIHLFTLGVGIIMVNALSEILEVTSTKKGIKYSQAFERGCATAQLRSEPDCGETGTVFRLKPDPTIFGEFSELYFPAMRALAFNSVHLFPGLKIQIGEECFLSKNGLKDYVETLMISESQFRVEEAISFRGRLDDVEVNFACFGTRYEGGEPWIKSWANGVFTDQGGVHVKGMNRALGRAGLFPKVAVISVILDSPKFGSPTKSKLFGAEIESAVQKILNKYFKSLTA